MPEPARIDIAAGGVVEDGEGEGLRIAVIYRPRHNDWSLPKGHVDPGETLEQAAVREVQEETGCTAEITDIVQPTSYLVNGQPKIVVFFRMELVEKGEFTPNEEVSEYDWLSPAEALQRLSYEVEKRVVRSAYGGN